MSGRFVIDRMGKNVIAALKELDRRVGGCLCVSLSLDIHR